MYKIITDGETWLKYYDHFGNLVEDINFETRGEYSKVMIKEIIAGHKPSCEHPIEYKKSPN